MYSRLCVKRTGEGIMDDGSAEVRAGRWDLRVQ